MNPCEHWEELLSARLDGPLTQEEARQLEDHLAACPRCRQYARELEETQKALQAWAAEPPPAVAEAILDAVRKAPRPAKRPRRAWMSLAAAAVLALVIWGAVQLPGAGETTESAAAADSAVMEQGPMEDSGASLYTNEEYSQESSSAEPEATLSALTQDQAEELLKDFLNREGRDLTLTPKGFSEDGTAWLFAARDSQGASAALFSVALDTGEIREIPAGTPEN
ncbi:MAG: zf-HC2 domain-containing protein [Evtepia sp.]